MEVTWKNEQHESVFKEAFPHINCNSKQASKPCNALQVTAGDYKIHREKFLKYS